MAPIAGVTARFFTTFLLLAQLVTVSFAHPAPQHDLRSNRISLLERSPLSLLLPNISANLPPSGFSFSVERDSQNVDSRDIFWLTLMAVADLAKEPFDSSLEQAWMIKKPSSGGIFVLLSNPTHPQGGFEVKYMIWGLLSAIRYMDAQNLFRGFRFKLKWQERDVGTIIFGGGRRYSNFEGAANFSSTTLPPASSQPNRILDFQVGWNTPDNPLPFNDVMMALIGGFSELVIHGMSDQVQGSSWRTAFPPYESSVEMRSLIPNVPWWTYDVIFDALAQLFHWYITHPPQDSRSAYIWIFIDKQIQGRGIIADRRDVVSESAAKGNISTW